MLEKNEPGNLKLDEINITAEPSGVKICEVQKKWKKLIPKTKTLNAFKSQDPLTGLTW